MLTIMKYEITKNVLAPYGSGDGRMGQFLESQG